jgi:hypothetical protein
MGSDATVLGIKPLRMNDMGLIILYVLPPTEVWPCYHHAERNSCGTSR